MKEIRRNKKIIYLTQVIGIFILMLAVISPEAAFADWKIYYTGIIGQQSGYQGRGSFATRAQCEQYRMTMPGTSMSYCGGFDTPSSNPGAAAQEQEKQRQLKLQKEKEEKEREMAAQMEWESVSRELLRISCIQGDQNVLRPCILNGTPCCPPYSCEGKFPNTYCVIKGSVTNTGIGPRGNDDSSVGTTPGKK